MTGELTLLTGGGGYLGRRLAHRLLRSSDATLLLMVRSDARRDEIAAELGTFASRVEFVTGDLESPDAFGAVDEWQVRRITSIVHAAAVTRFNVERTLAFRTNVTGTSQLLALARRCPRLRSLDHVSTIYATGLRSGRLTESLEPEPPRFANAYEESKAAAEQLVGAADDLPWRILRVATVLADDDTGTVSQYNAVHDTLKLFFYGLLALLPGRGDTPLYFVTGDFVTDAVVELLDRGAPRGVYHLAHDRSSSITLADLIDLAFAEFSKDDDFRRKRVLRPLLADETSFSLLVDGMSPIAGGLVTSALADVAPFAAQLFVGKDVDNSRLRAAYAPYRAPDMRPIVARACSDLVATRWGRRDAAQPATRS